MKDQARRTLILLIVGSIVLLWMTMRPFAEALFFACVLAGVLYPLHRRLRSWLRNRPQTSSGILCAAVLLALVAPFGGLAAFAVRESIDGARFVAQTVQSEGVAGLLDELPAPVRKVADEVLRRFPLEEQDLNAAVQEQASAQGGKAARVVTGALAATGSFMFQAALMTVALFFLLVDGPRLVGWLEAVSPLEEGQTTELLIEFRRVTGAVLISSLATALVQSLAAMLGYLISGVPHPVFFTTVTFFVSFIPAIGAGGMSLAAALILLAMGKTWMALFLAIWGVLVVGTVDNIIKPLLAKRGMDMHGAIVFFALIGGLTAFGTVGLLAGPLFVSFFLALVRIYQRDYGKNPHLVDATGRSAAESGRGSKVLIVPEGG